MKTHTPVPWNIGKDGDIWAENNTHCIHLIPDTLNAENNAAFIVKAVNCHDDLVGALDEALEYFTGPVSVAGRLHAALAKAKGE